MMQLVDDLKATIPQAFEKDEYRQRRDALEAKFKGIQDKAFGDFQERAEAQNVGLLRTPTGFALVPLKEGTILKPDEFKALSEEEQEKHKQSIDIFQEELEQIVEELPRMEKEYRVSVRDLNREVTQFAVRHQIMELRKTFVITTVCNLIWMRWKLMSLKRQMIFCRKNKPRKPLPWRQ